VQVTPSPTDAPALVVFGRDATGKPHASAFSQTEADLATNPSRAGRGRSPSLTTRAWTLPGEVGAGSRLLVLASAVRFGSGAFSRARYTGGFEQIHHSV
jgi:hypothetical protein